MKGLQSIYNILIFLFGGITFLFLFYLFFRTAPFMKDFLDMTTIGQIGDFIGGFIGTILGALTLILLVTNNIEQRKRENKIDESQDFRFCVGLASEVTDRYYNSKDKDDWLTVINSLKEFKDHFKNGNSYQDDLKDGGKKLKEVLSIIQQFSSVVSVIKYASRNRNLNNWEKNILSRIFQSKPEFLKVIELNKELLNLFMANDSFKNAFESKGQNYSSQDIERILKMTLEELEEVLGFYCY